MHSLEGTTICFGQEFSREENEGEQRNAPREFDCEIMEAPISQPYDFLNMVASSKDKKLVDFKKGKDRIIQEQPRWHSCSKGEF